jgi:hypothetical protein
VTGVNNIQYTAQFGNGVSGTIGLDDPTVFGRTSVLNLSTGAGFATAGSNAYGGTWAPDIVGNIRVDQAWGLFQVSGAAHLVNASYNTLGAGGIPVATSEINGHPDDKWGGSVMAALQIKNLPTGAGDDIKFDVSYAKGNTKNILSTGIPTGRPASGAATLKSSMTAAPTTTSTAWAPRPPREPIVLPSRQPTPVRLLLATVWATTPATRTSTSRRSV